MTSEKMLIFVPTYKERENVKRLFNEITSGLDWTFCLLTMILPKAPEELLEYLGDL